MTCQKNRDGPAFSSSYTCNHKSRLQPSSLYPINKLTASRACQLHAKSQRDTLLNPAHVTVSLPLPACMMCWARELCHNLAVLHFRVAALSPCLRSISLQMPMHVCCVRLGGATF